eukprot:GHVR01159028.1.p1 GENE.GHVR01159028.1~~GHVR01159028.1.p1  ORF type:complete len:274 (-),score=21.62 GHVR01159028.1:53-874(-)
MGLFSGIKSFCTGDDSGNDAANQIQAALTAANKGLETQFADTKANLDPFITAGRGALDRSEAGSTPQGFSDLLSQIFNTDIFKTLRDERTRAAEGQLAAGGLTRSGAAVEEIADIPTQIALALEQLLTGRSDALANQGLNTGLQLGNFGQNKQALVSGNVGAVGQAGAQGIIRDANSSLGAAKNVLSGISGGLGAIFSDGRLKQNVRKVGRKKTLNVYEWDWVPETEGTIIELCHTTGYMADEVREVYPEHVYSFGGFDVLDYESIEKELRAA